MLPGRFLFDVCLISPCIYRKMCKNKSIEIRFFYGSENIQENKGVPDRPVSNNQFSSVTLNKLAMKAI